MRVSRNTPKPPSYSILWCLSHYHLNIIPVWSHYHLSITLFSSPYYPTIILGPMIFPLINDHFRNLNWRYLIYVKPIFQSYVREYPQKKIARNLVLTYLHLRILEFPLVTLWYLICYNFHYPHNMFIIINQQSHWIDLVGGFNPSETWFCSSIGMMKFPTVSGKIIQLSQSPPTSDGFFSYFPIFTQQNRPGLSSTSLCSGFRSAGTGKNTPPSSASEASSDEPEDFHRNSMGLSVGFKNRKTRGKTLEHGGWIVGE